MQQTTKTRHWTRAAVAMVTVLLALLPFAAPAQTLTGSGTSGDPYLIGSKADWDAFATMVNGGQTAICGKMTADISLGNATYDEMMGTETNPYSGTFDGGGHTLTVNYTASEQNVAPFRWIAGATIKHLRTAGTFTVSKQYAAGIVARVINAASTIEGCTSSVAINSSLSGSGCHGGLVGVADAALTISDCAFIGSITFESTWDCSGMVGSAKKAVTINNSLVAAAISAGNNSYRGCYTFSANPDNVTISNSYYRNGYGTRQGTYATATQLQNGETAYLLQNGRAEEVWGVLIGTDSIPQLTYDGQRRVYKVSFTENDSLMFSKLVNNGKTVESFTAKDVVDADYYNDEFYAYDLSLGDGFSFETPVTGDMTVSYTVTATQKEDYVIASASDWISFANYVNTRKALRGLNAVMTADIDLGSGLYSQMIGTEANPYSGTFDGGGHTLTVQYSAQQQGNVAPFRWIAGATIKNFNTKGTFEVSQSNAAGIVARATKLACTIERCTSSVVLKTGKEGDASHGGIVAKASDGGTVAVTDCAFYGSMTGTTTTGCGGIIGSADGEGSTITNSLVAATFGLSADDATSNSIAPASVAVTNSYYLTALPNVQGTATTKADLASGAAAWALQGGRTERVWGMEIGTDTVPVLTADSLSHVNKVTFTSGGKTVLVCYANTGNTVTPPDIEAIAGDAYDASAYLYSLTYGDGYTADTPITEDRTVDCTLDATVILKDFDIASASDYKKFADYVSSGMTSLNATMTADVDLGSSVVMVGTRQRPYAGTFDGGGHTLTVNWSGSWGSDTIVAPFAYLGAATITRLKTSGSIRNTSGAANISGLAGYYGGDLTLKANQCGISITDEKVSSTVCGLYFAKSGDGDASVTVADCSVSGLLPGKTVYAFGLENTGAQRNQISNSLFSGEVRGTDLHIWGNATVSNSYFRHYDDYTLTDGATVAGSEVTARQLKAGYVLGKLQGGRTDAAYWGQTLGTDDVPSLFDESMTTKSEAYNYVYYNVAEGSMYCKDFFYEQSGAHNMQSLPIGLDFKAASIASGRTMDGSDDEPQFYTSCLPYDFAMEYYMDGTKYDVTEFKAYTLQGISSDGKTVGFKEVSGTLEAAQPYLLVVTAYTSLGTFNGGMVYGKEAESVTVGSVSLHGTYDRLENNALADSAAYILQSDNLWHPVVQGNSAWLAPFRAYLTIQSATVAKAMRLIDKNGMTTAISRISTTDSDGTTKYYDLNGRYIGTSLDGVPGGLYINNKGKKVRK